MAYKAEALELQRQLSQLQSQFDMLTGQASSLIQGKRARVVATSSVTGQLNTVEDSLSARNLEVLPFILVLVFEWTSSLLVFTKT